ncbi:MAG: GTP cyclohydrolase I [Alphaproteobacteria bacterium]
MAHPDSDQIINAVKTLIAYAGDDPEREGVVDTPSRVLSSYGELFKGYAQNGIDHLTHNRRSNHSLSSAAINNDPDLETVKYLNHIPFYSYCEHHMLPIIGHAHIAYLPNQWRLGSESLIDLLEIYARRLQIQEKMNAQIADDIQTALQPYGVGVVINSVHHCMALRGIKKKHVNMLTHHFTGIFKTNPKLQAHLIKRLNA